MREHYHKFQWFYLTFLAIIFISLGAYYFVHFGYYPAAIVNFDFIMTSSLNEEYAVVFRYYSKILANQGGVDINSVDFRRELRRAALNDLVEKSLIRQELKNRVGRELAILVENKINFAEIDGKRLEEAAEVLYGLGLADFKEMVLVPQAQREILEGRLYLEKKSISDWLTEAAGSARVTILTPEFSWDKNRVALR